MGTGSPPSGMSFGAVLASLASAGAESFEAPPHARAKENDRIRARLRVDTGRTYHASRSGALVVAFTVAGGGVGVQIAGQPATAAQILVGMLNHGKFLRWGNGLKIQAERPGDKPR